MQVHRARGTQDPRVDEPDRPGGSHRTERRRQNNYSPNSAVRTRIAIGKDRLRCNRRQRFESAQIVFQLPQPVTLSQGGDRASSCRCLCDYFGAVPGEVFGPGIQAWVEQPHLVSIDGIGCVLTSSFTKRARDAGKCQIIEGRLATRDHGNDVVDVERRLLSRLGQATVFASLARTFDDRASQVRRDLHGYTA